VDAFSGAASAKEGLKFSPAADAATLIRRVALDLTGLPPTLEELNTLSANQSTTRPVRIVDHYLSKPSYGEHWARQWLDLARYADSSGYPSDQPREIWAYRDWVIRALNSNMPFDQFTIEQNAGDLLPNPTDDQLIATAFHRNTMTQNEGGTDDEEFRNAAIIDRVNTTFAVWMGTTMACAQCHTHKYDPITINEYFQFYAFLNQSADSDKKDEVPLHSFDTPELKQAARTLKGEIDSAGEEIHETRRQMARGPRRVGSRLCAGFGLAEPKPIESERKRCEDRKRWLRRHREEQGHGELHGRIAARGRQTKRVAARNGSAGRFRQFCAHQPQSRGRAAGRQSGSAGTLCARGAAGSQKDAATRRGAGVQWCGKHRAKGRGEAEQPVHRRRRETCQRWQHGRRVRQKAVWRTRRKDNDPWWEVDLKAAKPVDRVVVWNRTDGNVGKRLDGFRVVLLDDKRQIVWKSEATPAPEKEKAFAVSGPVPVSFTTALADFEQSGIRGREVPLEAEKQGLGRRWSG
jgi:hypothetical protein